MAKERELGEILEYGVACASTTEKGALEHFEATRRVIAKSGVELLMDTFLVVPTRQAHWPTGDVIEYFGWYVMGRQIALPLSVEARL